MSEHDRRQRALELERLGDKLDEIIDATEKAPYEWWDEAHKAQHIIECLKWLTAQKLSDGKRRDVKDWGEYILAFAADEDFLADVPYEYHMYAMKDLEPPMAIGN